MADQLVIAGRAFRSRLIVGTGKYRNFHEMARAHAASGADMVTVAASTSPTNRKNPSSTTSTAKRSSSFPTPRVATPPTKPSAPPASAAKWASPTGSN